MHADQRSKMVVLGLDGLPFSLARTLSDQSITPHLAGLTNQSSCRPIRAEIPELSPVNWTSFYTGTNPGVHGVFGFTEIDPRTYRLGMVDFAAVRTPTVFDRLKDNGKSSRVINLPNTYPARDIGGWLISGFTALEFARAVHPPYLLGPLQAAGYRLEADTLRGRQDHDLLLAELDSVLGGRQKALDLFWPDLNWDLFVFVLTETDRLFHFLYPAVTDSNHPLHGSCLAFLRRWDALIGDVLERYRALPEPKRLMVLADHGFTELKTEVDLNVWLRREGYLATRGRPEDEWDATVIAPGTRAFALDPGRIYLHDRNRFSRGLVAAQDAERLREKIREQLLALTWNGEPVMEAVYRREELYSGPCLGQAPDLVCLARPGMDLKAKFDRTELFGWFGRSGTHTADDVFFYDSQGSRLDRIRETGQEILRFFDPASPSD
ncbi:MAG: alkaline phosphatase family protein [Desulfovibrionales bacterium]